MFVSQWSFCHLNLLKSSLVSFFNWIKFIRFEIQFIQFTIKYENCLVILVKVPLERLWVLGKIYPFQRLEYSKKKNFQVFLQKSVTKCSISVSKCWVVYLKTIFRSTIIFLIISTKMTNRLHSLKYRNCFFIDFKRMKQFLELNIIEQKE